MIIIHANMQIKLDQEQVFIEAVNTLLPATRAEEGNISYDLVKSMEQEGHYTMVEVWKDFEATTAHSTSEHFTAFTEKAATFMAAPMELKVFNGEPVEV